MIKEIRFKAILDPL